MDNNIMTDIELDHLLATTRQPHLPQGFADRLHRKLEQGAASNVVAFPQRAKQTRAQPRLWLSALPLAASLAIGIYVGAKGSLPDSLSGIESAFLNTATDSGLSIGIEDTESFLNGDLS
jgi:hypothetical protein